MFLIQMSSNEYVNAERIEYLSVKADGHIEFTMESDSESILTVKAPYATTFINNLSAIDTNGVAISTVEHADAPLAQLEQAK